MLSLAGAVYTVCVSANSKSGNVPFLFARYILEFFDRPLPAFARLECLYLTWLLYSEKNCAACSHLDTLKMKKIHSFLLRCISFKLFPFGLLLYFDRILFQCLFFFPPSLFCPSSCKSDGKFGKKATWNTSEVYKSEFLMRALAMQCYMYISCHCCGKRSVKRGIKMSTFTSCLILHSLSLSGIRNLPLLLLIQSNPVITNSILKQHPEH